MIENTSRRGFLRGLFATASVGPFIITTPGLLMPVRNIQRPTKAELEMNFLRINEEELMKLGRVIFYEDTFGKRWPIHYMDNDGSHPVPQKYRDPYEKKYGFFPWNDYVERRDINPAGLKVPQPPEIYPSATLIEYGDRTTIRFSEPLKMNDVASLYRALAERKYGHA